MAAVSFILRFIFWSVVVLTPVLGVWLASSLAAYLDGPRWAAILSGALLFPGLPLLWEFWALRKFNKKVEARKAADKDEPKRILAWSDRLIVRTLLVNLTFLAVLLWAFPAQSFMAVSARGDWFLDDAGDTSAAETARNVVFWCAENMEWSYALLVDNEYDVRPPPPVIKPTERPEPKPIEQTVVQKVNEKPITKDETGKLKPHVREIVIEKLDEIAKQEAAKKADETKPQKPVQPPRVSPTRVTGTITWPLKAELHPLVTNMPSNVETSIESVGTYLKRESDPVQRVKAIHDYVADRIAYDLTTKGSTRDTQSAETVFRRKTAVCAGYSMLAEALGKVTGDEIIYIVGVARNRENEDGAPHAWNAAKIHGQWVLFDVTWNSGQGNGVDTAFTKRYRTDYLFTPPNVFLGNHLPDRKDLQLVQNPISKAEWMRLPAMSPRMTMLGFELLSPKRPQVNVGEVAVITLSNANGNKASAVATHHETGKETQCERNATSTQFTCRLPRGRNRVILFGGGRNERTLWSMGELEMIY